MATTIRSNVVWSYLNWVTSFASPMILVPLYVRLLGNQLYGDWLVILSLTSYLGLANLGMAQTVSNRAAEAVARDQRSQVEPLLSTTFFTYAALAVVLIAALLGAAPLLSTRFPQGSGRVAMGAFLVYATLAMVSFPARIYPMMLRSFERVDQEQAIGAASTIIRTIALVIALLCGLRLLAVAIINGAAIVVGTALAYLLFRQLSARPTPRPSQFSFPLLREMIRPSIGFLTIQVGVTLIVGVDNIVIAYALGAAAVTPYAVPANLMTTGAEVFSVAVAALIPTITAGYALGRREMLEKGFLSAVRLALFYATAGVIALGFVGPAFIRLWAGPAAFPGRTTFALQAVRFFLSVMMQVPSTILWATTRHYRWSVLVIFEGFLNLALSLWWVHYWGLAGVIGATVVASLLTNAWYLPYAALRALDISIIQAAKLIAPSLLASLIAIAAATAAFVAGVPESSAASCAVAAALIFALAVTFYRVGMTLDERRATMAWIMKFWSPNQAEA